jgi:glycine/D-amino acid oxidase-like deaminating enzyme
MVGMSLALGTGKVVTHLLTGEQPPVDLSPYSPERFSRN